MKNKRKWKSLKRRGLAALLTLAMCLGTVPFTAFAAEDTHEHNQNGWNCEWVEPEQELNCQHEHDEDCYVPGEPVLECTDDHHDEDCYVPDEDVLTCENEDEDHEHDEDCYVSGEDVLACDEDHEHDEDCYASSEGVLECDEDHHTEDCYVSAEEVLDCRHEHAEDCFSAAEGFWSCTPPVEDTADEAGDNVIEEDQFDDDDNQGIIDEDETFEDDDQTVIEDEDVFNDDEQQNDVEDEDEALIPDEVQAFLDAVAAIPEITPENAEEAAEYVYGEVSEYYEALLGTEYEEREDVQEAVEVYAAAVEAVDAVLDMESEDFAVTARPYYEVFPNGVYGTEDTGVPAASERGYSGDTFVFNTLPIRQLSIGYYTNTYYPDAYYYHLKSTSDPNKIIDNIYYSVGRWTGSQGNGMPCFQVNIDTKEGAVGTARVQVLLVYYISELNGVAGQSGFFSRTMDCTIHVSAKTYTVTYTDGVTGEEIFTDQITRGLKFTDSIPEFNGIPEREGYTFNGWAPDLMETIEDAVAAGQAEEYYGYSEVVYTAQWEEDVEDTTYTVTYTDGVQGEIVFADQVYEELKAGESTPAFNNDKNELTREGYTFMGWAPTWNPKVDPNMADNDGVITYTATWQKKGLSKFTKELVETAKEAPEGVTGITYPDANGTVIVPADGTSITLLYKITVTGEKGTPYEVTDEGAKWVSGAPMKGTIPDSGKAVIYVTKSFTENDIDEGYLYNVAKVVPGTNGGSNTTSLEKTPAEVEQKQEYTLKYDANGGNGAPSEVKQENATFMISGTEPTRADFVFAGWADSADAKKAQYQPGGKITLTEPEKTLYAVWAQISVTKTMKKTEGSVDDDKLRNGDTVLYTVVVKNTGSNPLKNLEFFDDMDLKLTKPAKITIDSGWTVTSTYYPADDRNEKPLLYIKATGNTLEVGGSVVVQYEATIAGADGTKVINTVNVYAEIGEYVNAASRKMAAFRSDGPGGGASSEGETVGSSNVDVGEGKPGDRPKPPTGGVSGGDSTGENGGDTEKPKDATVTYPEFKVDEAGKPVVPPTDKTDTVAPDTTIIVDPNGGSWSKPNNSWSDEDGNIFKHIVADGESITLPDPTRNEDIFIGWTKKETTDTDGNKTITYTAQWQTKPAEKVTITIKYVDEAYVGEPNEIIGTSTKEFDKGSVYNVTDDIKAPEGYVIINIDGQTGGTADKNDTITVICRKDEPSNATVTYPEYTDDNTTPVTQSDEVAPGTIIIVDPNGGLWTPPEGSQWDAEGDTFKHVAAAGEQIALTNPARDEFVFVGWEKVEETDENGNKTITFTAHWVEAGDKHTITVNRVHNGNTIVSIPVTVPDGEAYTVTDTDAPAAFDNGGNHYIRIDALPTVPAGDEDVSIDVHYAIDNIGGGANGSSPDGIPDSQQAVVYYRSSNTAYGTVRDAYQMFDLRPDVASREETLRNAASTVGRARFTNWTIGGQALSTSATLENDFTVEAGHTYTVTANFTGYTGGGSGGGGGGGGGGGSSSGNTNNNTNNDTNNDTTTNDDTVIINDAEVPLADLTSLNREDHFAYVSGYTDGTVRPTNNITREEVAAIFYRLLTDVSRTVYETGVNNFSDVDSSRWSNNAISTLANAGIISGYKEGTFKPGQTITRAEFAAIASRFDTVSEDVTNPFTDTEGHWAEQLISNAADKGWVGGYPDSTFRPSNAITRAEAMTLINKVLNREVDKDGLLADAKQWPDNQEGKWYYYQVLEATNSHDYERRSADSNVENWTAITQK